MKFRTLYFFGKGKKLATLPLLCMLALMNPRLYKTLATLTLIAGVMLTNAAICAQETAPVPTPDYHSKIIDRIGDNAISLSGKQDAAMLKQKKYLFVYFSAHWCPPCRLFTPDLVKFYNKNYANGDFDLLFVSADHSQAEMNNYMATEKMPWIGLKLKSPPAKKLQSFKNGSGIPCLLLLDENDNVIASSFDKNGEYDGPRVALDKYNTLKKAEKKAQKEKEKAKN